VANQAGGLHSYSVNGSGILTHIDSDIRGDYARDVWGDGNFLYVAAGAGGLKSYSVDGSGNLTYIDSDDQCGNAWRVWGDGTFIYLANYTCGISTYSVDGSGILTYIDSDDQGDYAKSPWGDGTYLYLANSFGGLHSYSVNGSGILTHIDSDDQGDEAKSVWGDGNFIYLANGEGGLHSYSVNGSGILTHIDSHDPGGNANQVWGDGTYIYTANATSGVHSYSVDGSGILTHIDSHDPGDAAVGVWGDGTFLYIANSTGGLHSYSVSEGSQYIGWQNQGSGYTADSNICYEVEWHTVSSTLTGYGGDNYVIAGGLGTLPIYYTTTNTRPITGRYLTFDEGQGAIAMTRHIVRPRDRLPLAGGTQHLSHKDHQVRRYDVYNTQNQLLTGLDTGYMFRRADITPKINALSGKAYNITDRFYPTTTSSVTAERLFYEYKNYEWDVADFNMFTPLSAHEFALFLHAVNNFSLVSPLVTTSHSMLNLIGLCTYNGSPTAANEAFYCAAIARGNVPTWCHVVTGIQYPDHEFENFVICTTGCDLALPYITYRHI
jgi:6-phosphogluconolactonase (cycloisomerase 2 family)